MGKVARHDARVIADSARWLVRLAGASQLHVRADRPQSRAPGLVRGHGLRHARGPGAWVPGRDRRATRRCASTSRGRRSPRRGVGSPTRPPGTAGVSAGTRWCGRSNPRLVVESGVDKGLGTAVLAAALLRNADEGHPGRVTGIDINPRPATSSGPAPGPRSSIWSTPTRWRRSPAWTEPVDLFLHDSDHSATTSGGSSPPSSRTWRPGAPAHRQRDQPRCAQPARRTDRPAVPRLHRAPSRPLVPRRRHRRRLAALGIARGTR